jgi:hypothetical protein
MQSDTIRGIVPTSDEPHLDVVGDFVGVVKAKYPAVSDAGCRQWIARAQMASLTLSLESGKGHGKQLQSSHVVYYWK